MARPASILTLTALFVSCAVPLSAQGIRTGDTILSVSETQAALVGQTIEFFDGSKAVYGRDGRYSYTYAPGDPPFLGEFETREGGEVCVRFDNGFDRCDTYVRAGDRLVLIIADGTRYPVRSVVAN